MIALARIPLLAASVLLGGVLMPVGGQAAGLSGFYLSARQAELSGDIARAAELYPRAVALDPTNPALLERALVYSIIAGDVASAIPFAREIEKIAPDNRYAPLVFIVEELRAGAFPDVVRRIDASAEAFGPLLTGLLKGWALSVDDMAAADAAFDALGDNQTLRVFGGYHKALAHAVAGDLETAARQFEATDDSFLATNRRALLARAQILAASGRQARALEVLDTALAGDADAPVAALRARIATGDPVVFDLIPNATEGVAEALYTFGAVLGSGDQNRDFALLLTRLSLYLRPELEEARILSAEMLADDGQTELALAAYAAVPRSSVLFLPAEIGRSVTLAGAGRNPEAIVVLEELARAFPGDLGAATALADALRREERFADAATAYTTAIGLVPDIAQRHWPLFYQRGISNERSGAWDAAEADFRRALELQPDQPLVLNYLGYSMVELGRNLVEAEDMIRRAVAQRPDDGYITDSLGWVLYRLGRYDEAVAPMERAVELVPSDPVLNDHLGDVLWMVGRRLEARFQWRRALSFEPEEKDLARIRRKLDVGLDIVIAEEPSPAAPAPKGNDG